MKIAILTLGASVSIVVAIVVLVLLVLSATSFCDLVATLNTSIVAGEAVWDAVKDFAASVTDAMIDELPEDMQVAASTVLEAAKAIGSLALEILVEPLLGPFKTAVEQLNTACVRMP